MGTIGIVCLDPPLGHLLAVAAAKSPGMTLQVVARPGPGSVALLDDPPDVLVIDEATLRMPEVGAAMKRRADPKVVVVVAGDRTSVIAAFVAGADAVITVREAVDTLQFVLPTVGCGFCVLPRAVVDAVLADRSVAIDLVQIERIDRLTQREREVLMHLMAGEGHREIAISLDLSVHTVRFHVKQILVKLQVHSSLEAAMLGARAGLRFSGADERLPVFS